MRILSLACMMCALVTTFWSQACRADMYNIDEYKLKMYVYVPRIYDNYTSQGYRKYQRQYIVGTLLMCYKVGEDESPRLLVTGLENRTHYINKVPVTYETTVGCDMFPSRVYLIGNNKTGIFKTATVSFYLDMEPSYNVGEDDPDNSLLVVLSGKGSTLSYKYGGRYISHLTGNLAGTQGCGCRAYGHVSPTRIAGWRGPVCDRVVDVASVWGIWRAGYKRSYSANIDCLD